jgi:hypothetical protein
MVLHLTDAQNSNGGKNEEPAKPVRTVWCISGQPDSSRSQGEEIPGHRNNQPSTDLRLIIYDTPVQVTGFLTFSAKFCSV